jgi:hypothetical protein
MAKRRAYVDEYAIRVNRAVALLGERSPAAAARALATEHGLSERQARRYVQAARLCPCGVVVPERTTVFTVRLPASLIAGVRGAAAISGASLRGQGFPASAWGRGIAALKPAARATPRRAQPAAR